MSVKGDIAELKFMVLSRGLDYIICKPMSHHSRYDFIIEKEGCMSRVQVKSTSHLVDNRSDNAYICHSYTQKRRRRYLDSEIDYIAIYVSDYDAWYMIPISEIASYNIKLYPHRPNSKGKYEKFRVQ